jgi:hypothetical protein
VLELFEAFSCRVPSGNMATTSPRRQISTAVLIASRSASPRHRERAAGAQERAEDRVEDLDLAHEEQLPFRPKRQPHRPGIEVRGVVRGKDETALCGHVLDAPCIEPEDAVEHRPRDDRNEVVERRGHGFAAVSRCNGTVTSAGDVCSRR